MNAEEKKRYFQELTLNLQHEGFVVKLEAEDGLLPVELDGQLLCLALYSGRVRYRKKDAADEHRIAALDRVISIAKTTAEYMSQMEAAPRLTASGLTGDYRLLADFNGIVLAGHPTQYGVQFITWERAQEGTGLNHGNYYGPLGGTGCYTAAKRGVATRSGLVPRSALFSGTAHIKNEEDKKNMARYFMGDTRLAGLYAGPRAACRVGKGGARERSEEWPQAVSSVADFATTR